MNDYQPKVRDRVMVSEHGPYEVAGFRDGWVYILGPSDQWSHALAHARTEWLTPAPEPEPDEPTAPGALVRNGLGVLMARDRNGDWVWLNDSGDWERWEDIPSPVTVVLADPAEVETLRAEVQHAKRLEAERDELRRRIGKALNELTRIGGTVHRAVTILRCES